MRTPVRWEKKVAPGTRAANYRCSLPGLAGFVSFASPRAISIVVLGDVNYKSSHVAEREGFEPSVPFGTHDFQSCPFGHSGISPRCEQAPIPATRSRSPSRYRSPRPFPMPSGTVTGRGTERGLRALRALGGEGGIRTPGTLAGTPDFESGAIDQTLPPLHDKSSSQLVRRNCVNNAPHSAASDSDCSTRHAMIQPRILDQPIERLDRARLRIVAAEHHAARRAR